MEEVLEDYRILLEEKAFRVVVSIPGQKRPDKTCSLSEKMDGKMSGMMQEQGVAAAVYADRRALHFLLAQVISNAVKYSRENPELEITFIPTGHSRTLLVRDNGMGVRACDLPHIFDKGFTGDSGENRQKATGMGLYLVRELAREMNLTLEAESEWGEGFEIRILFPRVD